MNLKSFLLYHIKYQFSSVKSQEYDKHIFQNYRNILKLYKYIKIIEIQFF